MTTNWPDEMIRFSVEISPHQTYGEFVDIAEQVGGQLHGEAC
jgi:hypothetical protein